jgi:hypothetical protein
MIPIKDMLRCRDTKACWRSTGTDWPLCVQMGVDPRLKGQAAAVAAKFVHVPATATYPH